MSSRSGRTPDAPIDPSSAEVLEFCPTCREQTSHVATIDFLVENRESEHAPNSRQPYRVAECQECGTETRQRATNA